MGRYELAKAADEDFENILDYGIDTFGVDQALKYHNSMKQRFDELAEQPRLYPAVDHIREGYRRSVYGSHSIYYRIEAKRVLIVRILADKTPLKHFRNANPGTAIRGSMPQVPILSLRASGEAIQRPRPSGLLRCFAPRNDACLFRSRRNADAVRQIFPGRF